MEKKIFFVFIILILLLRVNAFDGVLTKDVLLEWGFNIDTKIMFIADREIRLIEDEAFKEFASLEYIDKNLEYIYYKNLELITLKTIK